LELLKLVGEGTKMLLIGAEDTVPAYF